MKLTGYSDVWTVRPGDSIGFHVHSEAGGIEAHLVRLLHGDENPRGPGFVEQEVESPANGSYAAGPQAIFPGSFARLDSATPLLEPADFAIEVWLWPTLPGTGTQGLLSWRAAETPHGLALAIDATGHAVALSGSTVLVRSREALAVRAWVCLTLTARDGRLSLRVAPRDFSPRYAVPDVTEAPLPHGAGPLFGPRLLLAALDADTVGRQVRPIGVFNGKLARPQLRDSGGTRAAFDFSLSPGSRDLIDPDRALAAICHNRPTRAMTGPSFGAPPVEPAEPTHDAVHFHDDDVEDAGWTETLRVTVPADLPSGVYAMRLRAGGAEDHVPFFVAAPRGKPGSRLALLMPAMSYLAYANESLDVSGALPLAPRQDMALNPDAYAYVAANGLKSTYDAHRDGSGISHGSRLRPIVDFRPKARCRTFDAPHQFAADLHLVHWLHARGYAVDIVTDDLLHAEGASVLAPYRVVITGTHPEYWTSRMLDARDAWLDGGGRLIYLGGNGFYWVTAVAEDAPHVIEIRRYGGTGTWQGEPGEDRLALTGERGGLWWMSGRPPQARLGVGFCGQGFDRGAPYRKTPAASDPRWAWIFAGVAGEVFGAGPSLVLGHGAAGFEIDRTDPAFGTPEHTVVLASADGFTDAYQTARERVTAVAPWLGGSDPRSGLRADMTITPGPNGGAVFTTGSISYAASLNFENGNSESARVLANVIEGMLADRMPA